MCQIPCEKNVLAASIAASPGKLAVAAILEGRMAIYVDIIGKPAAREVDPWETVHLVTNTARDTAPIMDLGNAAAFSGGHRSSQRRDSLIASQATGLLNENVDASIEITTQGSLM